MKTCSDERKTIKFLNPIKSWNTNLAIKLKEKIIKKHKTSAKTRNLQQKTVKFPYINILYCSFTFVVYIDRQNLFCVVFCIICVPLAEEKKKFGKKAKYCGCFLLLMLLLLLINLRIVFLRLECETFLIDFCFAKMRLCFQVCLGIVLSLDVLSNKMRRKIENWVRIEMNLFEKSLKN